MLDTVSDKISQLQKKKHLIEFFQKHGDDLCPEEVELMKNFFKEKVLELVQKRRA